MPDVEVLATPAAKKVLEARPGRGLPQDAYDQLAKKLSDVANGESVLPRDYMNESGTQISKKFRAYLTPLVQGEVKIPLAPDGLPINVRLKRKLIARKLPLWEAKK